MVINERIFNRLNIDHPGESMCSLECRLSMMLMFKKWGIFRLCINHHSFVPRAATYGIYICLRSGKGELVVLLLILNFAINSKLGYQWLQEVCTTKVC